MTCWDRNWKCTLRSCFCTSTRAEAQTATSEPRTVPPFTLSLYYSEARKDCVFWCRIVQRSACILHEPLFVPVPRPLPPECTNSPSVPPSGHRKWFRRIIVLSVPGKWGCFQRISSEWYSVNCKDRTQSVNSRKSLCTEVVYLRENDLEILSHHIIL